jgi:hypothetical protein
MHVDEALTGVEPGQKDIEIVTGAGGGDCGYAFRSGVAYVIYAYKNSEGRLETGICSRTRPLTEAAEDVAYFHGLATATETGEIRVVTTIPSVKTTIDGNDFHSSVTTDVHRRAVLGGLQPGEYVITMDLDGAQPVSRTVWLHVKGCAEVQFFPIDLRLVP